MREITIGGKVYGIAATPFTLWIYRDEFSEHGAKKADIMTDLFGSISQFAKMGIDPDTADEIDTAALLEQVDFGEVMGLFYPLLQATWAMCKTCSYPAPFPAFRDWLRDIGDVDLFALLQPVWEEAQRGFFRNAAPATQGIKAAEPAI